MTDPPATLSAALGEIHASPGEKDLAFAGLERAAQHRPDGRAQWLGRTGFSSLRPAFYGLGPAARPIRNPMIGSTLGYLSAPTLPHD